MVNYAKDAVESFNQSPMRRVHNVTVCIAARSGPNLIGASDRMLTSGDIQFEPTLTSKLTQITTSLAVFTVR